MTKPTMRAGGSGLLGAVTLACALLGCGAPAPAVDPAGVTKLEIAHPEGVVTVTDREAIAGLVEAMKGGTPDDGVYDTPKTTRVSLYAGDSVVCRVQTGSCLFDLDGQQYRSKAFERALAKLIAGQRNSGG